MRRIKASRFRQSSEFEALVEQAIAAALKQPFCTPLEYAQSRARHASRTRDAVTWKEVQERLGRSKPEPPVAAQEPRAPASPNHSNQRRFAVGLLTDVGPESPAAALNKLAARGEATVEVMAENEQPMLVYTVSAELAEPAFDDLIYEP